MSNIYAPAEDSYFLSEIIKKNIKDIGIKILDMGSGSGIQSEILIKNGIDPKNITLVDINNRAINSLKKKFSNCNILESNLFEKIKDKFDLIIFNPLFTFYFYSNRNTV